jgi:hypothetical protein
MMPATAGGMGEARNAIGTATTAITTETAGGGGSITRIATATTITGGIAGIPIGIVETSGSVGIIVNR